MLSRDQRFEGVCRRLRDPIKRGRCPGVAACAFVGGRLALLEETGYADRERRVPMTADSIVRLYSMTKCVVAAAVTQCASEGLFGLDDPLMDHLACFSAPRVIMEDKDGMPDWDRLVPAKRPITIRHLLTHTSGISSGLATGVDGPKVRSSLERAWAGIYSTLTHKVETGEIASLGAWVEELAKLPLFTHPGVEYGYGYSYDVLGHLVEVKTGMNLQKYLKQRIFDPLRMRHTCFDFGGGRSALGKRLSVLYRYTKSTHFGGDGRKPRLVRVDPQRVGGVSSWKSVKVPSGGGGLTNLEGGLLSTLSDYAKFLLAVVSGGAHPVTGHRILTPAAAAEMLADQTSHLPRPPIRARPYNDRGLALSCVGELQLKMCPKGQWFDGVPGVRLWGGAASTCFKYDPNAGESILVILMTQLFPQDDGTVITEMMNGVRETLGNRD